MGTNTEQIFVERPIVVDKETLICKFTCTPGIGATFRTDAYVTTYRGFDISQTPESLLLIPLLGILAPIAWAADATIRIPTVDPVFFESLHKVRASFRELYPKMSWNGAIVPDAVAAPTNYPVHRPAVLFSGGVDSVASYIVHRNEDPVLVSALGRTPFHDLTEDVKLQYEQCKGFAGRNNARFVPAITNLNRMLDATHLPLGMAWWQKVQHGLAFLSLCAPISPIAGLHTVYLASTHTADSKIPWGSHPAIDNNVAWASTVGNHDCYHLSRQQKLGLIAKYIEAEDPTLKFQICRRGPRHSNCSECGKCSRTMIGLATAGVDPNLHGFRLDKKRLENIRTQLTNRKFLSSANNRFMWWDIQRHVPDQPKLAIEGLREFFAWFRKAEIDPSLGK